MRHVCGKLHEFGSQMLVDLFDGGVFSCNSPAMRVLVERSLRALSIEHNVAIVVKPWPGPLAYAVGGLYSRLCWQRG